MQLLDIVCIDNQGRTCTVFVALLSGQTEESFLWAVSKFKEALVNPPIIIYSDEEEALRNCK